MGVGLVGEKCWKEKKPSSPSSSSPLENGTGERVLSGVMYTGEVSVQNSGDCGMDVTCISLSNGNNVVLMYSFVLVPSVL